MGEKISKKVKMGGKGGKEGGKGDMGISVGGEEEVSEEEEGRKGEGVGGCRKGEGGEYDGKNGEGGKG
jgi:hypothetical protein